MYFPYLFGREMYEAALAEDAWPTTLMTWTWR